MTIHDFLKNKKILVFGLGRQGGGLGDANYLAQHGYRVRATDLLTLDTLGIAPAALHPGVELSLGGHTQADIDWADLILKNPAVPDEHPLVQRAQAQNKIVATAIALFVKFSPIPTIGITGTRGKTTTTHLIYQILNHAYPDSILLGGNLPDTSGLALFDLLEGKKFAVLELSSFQLHSFHDLAVSPTYSVITNLYPDHLNRYSNMESYRLDKEAIVAYQVPPGFTVYNQENEGSRQIAMRSPVDQHPANSSMASAYSTRLPGEHNLSNLALALTLCHKLGIPESHLKEAVSKFGGVPFRLELIRTHRGIKYVNDTTATTPTAALAALRATSTPTILICGGESKNLPQTEFIDEINNNERVKKVILLGSRRLPEFVNALKAAHPPKIVGQVDSMQEAVALAQTLAQAGDTVLLSPGFASFDLFQNEFDRGRQFNDCVRSL